jgi:glucokinase
MFLGIEIGGTKLQLGLGAGDGNLTARWRGAVDVSAGGGGIRQQILTAVPELLGHAKLDRAAVRGVGIGFGGPVDDVTRTVILSHQIRGWDGFPLAEWITELLGWPAVLGNDADVAGLAEALFGAGKGLSPVFYITIGSGIGGGLIINGEIYRGCGRGAAEIGHLTLTMDGEDPTSGGPFGDRPLELLSSGWHIQEIARALAVQDSRGSFNLRQIAKGELGNITARHVGEAARQGDAFALDVLRAPISYLARAIRQVIVLLCPRRIIIGGGVSLMGEQVLLEPLRRQVAERVFGPFAECYEIVPAALGEDVVIHGALALARQRLGALSSASR